MAKPEETLNNTMVKVAKKLGYENSQVAIKPTTSNGANYTSVLYNVTLQAPGKEDLHLFAKVALVGQKMRAADPFKIFDTENLFYTTLINIYEQLEKKNNVPEEGRLVTPKFYEGSLEYMKEIMILEDLSAKGFSTFDRLQSITWEFAAKSLENLAKFHALSIAFAEDDPQEFKNVVSKLKQGESFDSLQNYIKNVTTTALKVVKDENRDRLAKFTDELQKKEVFENFFQEHRRPFITHRDYRQSNLMYRMVIMPVGLVSSIFCLLVITADKENVPKVSEDLVFDDFAIDPNDLYIERETAAIEATSVTSNKMEQPMFAETNRKVKKNPLVFVV
ncbi:ecdysteroid 22-kinase [Danaus plexippus plexippus]|uniref:Ecdysteroid 22-kinase n=1 Tax=Danaus plexippus plexippus TaxID=278856 RepID=A0A212F2J0_DANPL|nr:ecdysteroid 22-kinase [Danaus plexippus plexippus]